jgi:hypothetical protein
MLIGPYILLKPLAPIDRSRPPGEDTDMEEREARIRKWMRNKRKRKKKEEKMDDGAMTNA